MITNALPPALHLPVSALASAFDEVTNSYKFYWFLAILESLREDTGPVLPLDLLLARMISGVWYPVNYFRLSFGKQDQLGKVIALLGEKSGLPMDSPRPRVNQIALDHLQRRDEVGRVILSLGNFVPYRFLRPFFAEKLRGAKDWEVNCRIRQLAGQEFNNSHQPCLYRFTDSPNLSIELHPAWAAYLRKHLAILTGFCLWHLVNYLQRNNPNVPGIAAKLFEPQARDLTLARKFWTLALKQNRTLSCIYSGQPFDVHDFSLDHFLPWRFVTHDLLWNLIPTPKAINSSKSDNLPDLTYFDPFARLQYQAVQAVLQISQVPKLLEDYILLFKISGIGDLKTMDFTHFRDSLYAVIVPQMQIAANMGFSTGWKYMS